MKELLLQDDLNDPEQIKQGMQQLVSGQTQLYKDVIKAINTQEHDDIMALKSSISGLVNSALKLGKDSGEGSVDKEAQVQLENNNVELQKTNEDIKTKLEKSRQEMETLESEYNNMMGNVNKKPKVEEEKQTALGVDSSEKDGDNSDEQQENDNSKEELIDMTAAMEGQTELEAGRETKQEVDDSSVEEGEELIDMTAAMDAQAEFEADRETKEEAIDSNSEEGEELIDMTAAMDEQAEFEAGRETKHEVDDSSTDEDEELIDMTAAMDEQAAFEAARDKTNSK